MLSISQILPADSSPFSEDDVLQTTIQQSLSPEEQEKQDRDQFYQSCKKIELVKRIEEFPLHEIIKGKLTGRCKICFIVNVESSKEKNLIEKIENEFKDKFYSDSEHDNKSYCFKGPSSSKIYRVIFTTNPNLNS